MKKLSQILLNQQTSVMNTMQAIGDCYAQLKKNTEVFNSQLSPYADKVSRFTHSSSKKSKAPTATSPSSFQTGQRSSKLRSRSRNACSTTPSSTSCNKLASSAACSPSETTRRANTRAPRQNSRRRRPSSSRKVPLAPNRQETPTSGKCHRR
jgi:hypothetical protein